MKKCSLLTERKNNSADAPRTEERLVYMTSIDFNDKRFQVREGIDQDTVAQYRQVVSQGPGVTRLRGFCTKPLLWKREDDKHVICAGWHRILAGKAEQVTEFEADVIFGDETAAMIAAMKSNFTHGLQLKPAEREMAVLQTIRALTDDEGVQPSSSSVAAHLGVSEASVRIYRERLEKGKKLAPADTVRGKDGKKQAARKTKATAARRTPPDSTTDGETDARHVAEEASEKPQDTGPVIEFISEDEADEQAEQEMDEPACEDSEDASDADENTDPHEGWIETLTRAVEVLEALQQRGWDSLRVQGCTKRLEWIVTRVIETGEAFLEARRNRLVASAH